MAVVSICHTLHSKDSISPVRNVLNSNKISCICEFAAISKNLSCSPSIFKALQPVTSISARTKGRRGLNVSKEENWSELASYRYQNADEVFVIKPVRINGRRVRCSLKCESEIKKLCSVWYASGPRNHLRSLVSYFGRLQGSGNEEAADPVKTEELLDTGQFKAKKKLELLDAYFQKVDKDVYNNALSTFDEQSERKRVLTSSSFEDSERGNEKTLNDMIHKSISNTAELQEDDIFDLYLISVMISINIAVFLFEMASPVKNSDLELFSLPSLYGAKINHLILVGEWWRLVTPMFLHTGLPHVAFSCWALLTFGRQICRGYGPFTFFLIYVLGGVSGNLTSFLHTPEPTVGGTGPVFAMIGAWLVYQFQNKDVVAKEVADDMFLKAVIAAVISSILTNFGPIDEWSHTGAAFSGMLYGFLTNTSPALQVGRRGQEEGIKLVRKYADPCKSLTLFTLLILVLSCLVFFIEPHLNTLELHDF